MVTVVNPLDDLKQLIASNWNSANTDTIVPSVEKIYTQPKNKNPNPGQDFIYLYSELTVRQPVGIGEPGKADETNTIKIDIRSRPSNNKQADLLNDAHAYKCKTELLRVLYSLHNNPNSNFNLLNPNLDETDLSDGVRGIFRYVIRIELKNYYKDMI